MGDHEASKLDKSNHLLLDQPLLRLPYELLRKNFRSAHFAVEKDSAAVKNLLKETAKNSISGRAGPDDVLKSLDTMVVRMRALRRKLVGFSDEEERLTRQVDARLSHLGELAAMQTLDDVTYEAWSRRRLDRLLVDYLLRHGYAGSATALADERSMRDLVDVETFVQMGKIRDSLKAGSVTEALAWCNDNKKELRKMDSKLEFMLRYQQYIELVRSQSESKMLEAIAHARKHLVPYRDVYPKEFGQAAGLLAFTPSDRPDTYADIWTPDRWRMLADLFTQTHNQLLSLPSFPLLHMALSSGLSALKTPACHSSRSRATAATTPLLLSSPSMVAAASSSAPLSSSLPSPSPSASSMCPICSTELNELARAVPYAHHSKSHVEHDLLLLPNGRVYGKARLDEYAAKAALPPDKVKDLRTGDVYPRDKLKKVFIT